MIWIGIAGWLVLALGGLWLAIRQGKARQDMEFRLNTVSAALAEVQRSLTIVEGKLGMRDGEVVRQITENLDSELEKSANMTEMRKARRRHLPRENAGPPAKVGKMRFTR